MRTRIDWDAVIASGACTQEQAKNYADVVTCLDNGQAVVCENMWRLSDADYDVLDKILDFLLPNA